MRRLRGRRLARAAAVIAIAGATVALPAAVWIAWPLPHDVASPSPVPSLEIRDRHGLTLRTTRSADGSRGGWIALDDVDPELLQAFVAAEDARFFEHHGIDTRAVMRAARDNIAARRIVSGASTITMQTARLLRPAGNRWTGKAAQALWALRLDAHLDKQRILELYLNRVPLGQGAVGVSGAAQLYLGATAADLSLGQAALLAGLARAPSRDNPLVAPSRARDRRDAVLARLSALGMARSEDIARAVREDVRSSHGSRAFLAPHFTTRLLQWVERGTAEGGAESGAHAVAAAVGGAGEGSVLGTRGMAGVPSTGIWRTTLDLELQRALEAEVRHTVSVLRDRAARHAAVVVLDNPTGAILAWVGSPDFHADTAGQVDMVVSRRQPGSALKPFLYGLALDRGYTAATVLPDVPRTFMTSTGAYRPQNYDRRFRGPVRAREALASSYNVPAVVLTERLGAAALLETLRDAGLTSLDRPADHYGLGLSLGNGEVTLLELANAYRGIANGGVWTPVQWRQDEAERVVRTAARRPGPPAADSAMRSSADGPWRRFMSGPAAALLLDILSDPVARTPGFGAETALDFPFPVAAKTGTSRHFTDNWAVATTARFTVAVWVGNFSGRPMRAVSGITGAGPLLYRAVLQVAERYPPGRFPSPEMVGAIATPVCVLSGMRASAECPAMIEWFLPGTEPGATDEWQRDGRTVLPPEYAEWIALNERARSEVAVGSDATPAPSRGAADVNASQDESPLARSAADRRRAILSPLDGDVYERPVGADPRYATIPLVASGTDNADPVRWLADGRPLDGSRWRLEPGAHTISAHWPDGATHTVRITVR
jgi:penicillin-binding protein 1C